MPREEGFPVLSSPHGKAGSAGKNVRYNWDPIEKCAVQLGYYRKMCGTNVRQNWIRSSRQRRPSYPENPQANADRPDRRRPGKSPIRRRPAGPPPAGKIPKPKRLVLSAAVCCCRRHTGKPALPAKRILIEKGIEKNRTWKICQRLKNENVDK